jgi:hypothetical protein
MERNEKGYNVRLIFRHIKSEPMMEFKSFQVIVYGVSNDDGPITTQLRQNALGVP